MNDAQLRIGELARRVGVSADLLRAWERRYGLLEPTRTQSGYRLYSDGDVARVRSMQAHLGEGLSAAEAAQLCAELRDWLVSEYRKPDAARDVEARAIFAELEIAEAGLGRRHLLESARFRALLAAPPAPARAA